MSRTLPLPYAFIGNQRVRVVGEPIGRRVSLLDTLAIEVAAQGWREFFDSPKGRWFVLQQRWKLEDRIKEAEEKFKARPRLLALDYFNFAVLELRWKLEELDSWVEDPRRMFQQSTVP